MITNLCVRENQAVRQGDLLFELDARAFRLAVELMQARRATLFSTIEAAERDVAAGETTAKIAQANIERARAAQGLARKTLERITPMHAEGYVADEEYDAAVTALAQADADVTAAVQALVEAELRVPDIEPLRRELKSLDVELALAELELSHTAVHAPFDGRVLNLQIREGQVAAPGVPLFTLLDTSTWHVTAKYRETDLHAIHPGDPADIRLPAYPDRTFTGTVESIGWGVESEGDIRSQLLSLPYVRQDLDWVRLAQRFPVRIRVDGLPPDQAWFRAGESAVVVMGGDRDRTE